MTSASSSSNTAPPAPTPSDIETLWKIYALVNEWIRHADQKISLLLAVNALIGATVATLLTIGSGRESGIAQQFIFRLFNQPLANCLSAASGFFLFLSILFCLLCILPRLWAKEGGFARAFGKQCRLVFRGQVEPSGSPLYFMDLADKDFTFPPERADYLQTIDTPPELASALMKQIAAVSGVARHKYLWTTRAVWALVVALLLAFLALLANFALWAFVAAVVVIVLAFLAYYGS